MTKPKPPKLRNLTPPLCEKLQQDMLAACQKVADEYGLTVLSEGIEDMDLRHSFTLGLRVGIPLSDGTVYDPDKVLFEALAEGFGLDRRGSMPVIRNRSRPSSNWVSRARSRYPFGHTHSRGSQLRQGSYFPGFLEPRKTSERALVAVPLPRSVTFSETEWRESRLTGRYARV